MQRSNWYHVKHVLRQTWQHPSNRSHRVRSVAGALGWQLDKRLRRRPRDVPFFGLTLRCHPDSQSASNVVYFTERYDPDEMAVAEAYLRSGDWFLDVGANIGTYSLMARSFVGPEGRVDGFEPHPTAARRFAENVTLNDLTNVYVHAQAVSDSDGTVEFLDGSDVSNRVATALDGPRRTLQVPTVTLDDTLPAGRYAMGKIDVEGFETAAFRGAVDRLASSDPPFWQVEMLDGQLMKAGSSRAELVALLESFGYGFAAVDDERSSADAVRLRWIDPGAVATFNMWAVHRPSLALIEERLGSTIS